MLTCTEEEICWEKMPKQVKQTHILRTNEWDFGVFTVLLCLRVLWRWLCGVHGLCWSLFSADVSSECCDDKDSCASLLLHHTWGAASFSILFPLAIHFPPSAGLWWLDQSLPTQTIKNCEIVFIHSLFSLFFPPLLYLFLRHVKQCSNIPQALRCLDVMFL